MDELWFFKLVTLTVLQSSFLFVTFDIMLGRHSIMLVSHEAGLCHVCEYFIR